MKLVPLHHNIDGSGETIDNSNLQATVRQHMTIDVYFNVFTITESFCIVAIKVNTNVFNEERHCQPYHDDYQEASLVLCIP